MGCVIYLQYRLCPFKADTTPWLRQRAHFGVRGYLSAADLINAADLGEEGGEDDELILTLEVGEMLMPAYCLRGGDERLYKCPNLQIKQLMRREIDEVILLASSSFQMLNERLISSQYRVGGPGSED